MIRSWDVFDTMIGRRCGTPYRLWAEVGREANWPGFADARLAAERSVQTAMQSYGIDDVFRQFAADKRCSAGCAEWLRDLELQAERRNAFAIARYANQVNPGDIAVSDMYLTAEQIRAILDAAGIERDIALYVSCHGKSTKSIWRVVRAKHKIEKHTGDNRQSDFHGPRTAGIKGELAQTGLSDAEQHYAHHGSEALAWWLRYHRLRVERTGHDATLAELQLSANVPFLLAVCTDLRAVVARRGIRRVLFLARDGCLIRRLWDRLFPDVPSEYVYGSRECFRSPSPGYLQYITDRITPDAILVDLAASFRSFAVLAEQIPVVPPVYTGFWVSYDGKVSAKLDMTKLIDQRECRVNNTYLEMLNYAQHWHVADVSSDGVPVFDQQDEYPMELAAGYHRLLDEMIADLPTEPVANPSAVAEFAMKRIGDSGRKLAGIFPGHMQLEVRRNLPASPAIQTHAVASSSRTTCATSTTIVGAIDGYDYGKCELWLRSIKQSGFRGSVHMLTYRCNPRVLRMLQQQGVTCHVKQHERHVVICRFRDLSELAKTLPPKAWMIQLDVSDIVAQSDPDAWLERQPSDVEIVAGSETIRFGDHWWIWPNLLENFPEHADEMREWILYNAGSFAARAGTMAELASDVWTKCTAKPFKKQNDQDALNWLLRQPKYAGRTLLADQRLGWCANVAASVGEPKMAAAGKVTEHVPTIRDGVCYVEDGVVPVFLHHYPRIHAWRAQVERRIRGRR